MKFNSEIFYVTDAYKATSDVSGLGTVIRDKLQDDPSGRFKVLGPRLVNGTQGIYLVRTVVSLKYLN